MPIKINDIDDALIFVNSSRLGENTAMLCRSTGQICYASEACDMDEIPEEAYDSDDWIEIPDSKELGLGRELVFEFVASHLPSEADRVRAIFKRSGAYRRYKDLLEAKGIIQQWYDFEEEEKLKAIEEWCEENDIVLSS